MKNLNFIDQGGKLLRAILPLAILLYSLGVVDVGTVYAVPPGNNLFANRTVINSLPFTPGLLDTQDADQEVNDPTLTSAVGGCEDIPLRQGLATVWYEYTGTNTPVFLNTAGSYTETNDPFNPGNYQYDTYIAVFTSTVSNPGLTDLKLLSCNDNPDNATNQAELSFYGFAGTKYYIEVAEYNGRLDIGYQYPGYNGGFLNFTATVGLSISGNVGLNGAKVAFPGGAAFANSNGDYILAIPIGFTGTVRPSLSTGATFTPANRPYNNVTSSLTGQNYTAQRTFQDLKLWTTDFSYYPQGWRADLHPRVMGDVNGDGKDDVVGFGYGGVLVGLSNGTIFSPVTSWTTDFSYNQGWRMDTYPRMVGDVNGDGKDDIVGFGFAGAVVALSNGAGFNPLSLWTTDFSYSPQGWRANLHPREMGDVNGDGKDDIVGFGYGGVLVALSNGSSFDPATRWTEDFSYNQGWRMDTYPRMVGDVNGDGKDDLVGFGYAGAVVALSNGTSFSPLSLWTTDFSYYPQGWRVNQHPRVLGDINGDGKDDIVGFGYGGVVIALSTGTGFAPAVGSTSNFSYSQGWRVELYPRMVGDPDGDGKDDLVGFGYGGVLVNR